MLKKLMLAPIMLCFCLLPVHAMLNKSSLLNLDHKLSQLLAPYGGRVGICFIDLKSGWELQINGRKKYPAASVIKLAVMAAAYHLSETGELDLGKKIRLEVKDKLGGSGVLQWMKPGREYTLWNLIRLMIVLSDNTATKMLVNEIGRGNINLYLRSIGLSQSYIVDDTMLNEPPLPMNHTTPEEMALLLIKIQQARIFNSRSSAEMLSFMKNQRYRWGIWRGVPRGVIVADKTGEVGGVLNDAGIVYSPAGPYALSIFTDGFNKLREARLLINQVATTAYEAYTGTKESLAKPILKKKIIRRYRKPIRRHKRVYRYPKRIRKSLNSPVPGSQEIFSSRM